MSESSPTTDPFVEMLADEVSGQSPGDIQAAIEEMERQGEPVVSEDFEDVFGDTDINWYIPTGKFTEGGQPKLFKVTVRDPMDPTLPTKYFMAMQRNPKGAIRALWKSCIVQPRAICDDEATYKRLSSSFRMSMNLRIMDLIGVNQDFLETTQAATGGRKKPPQPKTSSGPLPESGDATQGNSSLGVEATFTAPTPQSSPAASSPEPTSSPTSDTLLPRPSEESEPKPSVTPSRSAGDEVLLGRTPT